MPPWFIEIESATEIEAKSKGTPPAARTAAAASRANSPRSALQGVTRPSVDAMPMKGFARSASDRPRLRRNARCGARSSPSTVMREGSFFVFTHDLVDRLVVGQAERRSASRERRFRHRVDDRLHTRIRLEAHLAARARLHRIPHLLCTHRNAGEEDRSPIAERAGRQLRHAPKALHYAGDRDARHARIRSHGTEVIASGER